MKFRSEYYLLHFYYYIYLLATLQTEFDNIKYL